MYFFTCSNNNNELSTLLYNGLLSKPEYPFGTNPYFTSLIIVCRTSFAILNLFGINNKPSKDINVSLPQSKNHGYPAIIVCKPKLGLLTIKLSDATTKVLTKFSSYPFSIKPEFLICFFSLAFSFFIICFPSISSIFSSNEHTKVISFCSFGAISISNLPGMI